MQRQYLELKRQHPDSILMFRLGDFFEMFNEDAKIASKTLDIVLTSRGEGVDKWPMCGVPHHSVESYIAKLLKAGYTVALADQVEDASQAKGLVKRDVVRVITPGTLLESSMLEEEVNNYLLALVEHEGVVGLASIDISTGEFQATEIEGSILLEQVMSEIDRISPSEILLPDSLSKKENVQTTLENVCHKLTHRNDLEFSARTAEQKLKEQFGVKTLEGYGIHDKRVALGAAGAVLEYLNEVLKTNTSTMTGLRTYSIEEYMVVDGTTQRNLELIKNARDGSQRGTLLSVLSGTQTAMGKRKIKHWILQPLCYIERIEQRLDAVEELSRSAIVRQSIVETLRPLGDLERITSRIAFGSANARDLLSLLHVLERIPRILDSLKQCTSELLANQRNRIDPLQELRKELKRAIVDDPPATVKEGGMIRAGYDDSLDNLRESIASDKRWIASLQARERRRTGIKSLKVGYNKVFGYYIEITKSNLANVPDDYDRKQTLTNAERFITPELKEKEASVLAGEDKINSLEYELYEELRNKVRRVAKTLHENADSLATVDVIAALAETAVRRRYCRPHISEDTRIEIVDGRHPSMEMILRANEFVPNSLEMGNGNCTLLIVTGPNMSGKSTFGRQAAIIAIMAQMGSFVPAKQAHIGLIDRVFTRVGAFDDLTARQSTFMVEMIETANILNNATEKSLVVLDEIGRGTSTFDGMALAWAVAERIVQKKTRAIFATHFHQLTDMASEYHGVKNVHTLAREGGDSIVFLHKVVEGGTDKSYGVHVAALAGVPEEVVNRARQLLSLLEKQNKVEIGEGDGETVEEVQTSLEPLTVEDPIIEQIRHLDLERITPIDALLRLKEIKDEIRRRDR
jgi:DNA mismatch repair protein MutS